MEGLRNLTVVRLELLMDWTPSPGASPELRLQTYHRYPSGPADVGREYLSTTQGPPLAATIENVSIPIVGSGKMVFVVFFKFEHSPFGNSYQLQANQDFHLSAKATVRNATAEDMAQLDPPQQER